VASPLAATWVTMEVEASLPLSERDANSEARVWIDAAREAEVGGRRRPCSLMLQVVGVVAAAAAVAARWPPCGANSVPRRRSARLGSAAGLELGRQGAEALDTLRWVARALLRASPLLVEGRELEWAEAAAMGATASRQQPAASPLASQLASVVPQLQAQARQEASSCPCSRSLLGRTTG